MSVTEITLVSDYGAINFILLAYLVLHFFFFIWLHNKTKPFGLDQKKLLKSSLNNCMRLLCLMWLGMIFFLGRAVLFVSSETSFLPDKLFLLNIMYIISFFVLGIFAILFSIKYWNKSTGLSDLIGKIIYEVKNE